MVNRDRGQLILVGAIAIALILLGLVLIVNTALFTQVVGSEGTVESAKEGGVSGQEIGNSISAVVAEANRQSGPTDIDETVSDDLEPAFTRRTMESGGSFVSMEYLGSEENGSLIEQSGGLTGTQVNNSDVGEFLVTLDTDENDAETFDITVDPTSSGSSTLSVTVGKDEIELSGADASECSNVRVSDSSVTIDVRHGVVYGDNSCQFELFDGTSPPYDITFDAGDNMDATYSITTDQTGVGDSIVWSFEYRFTYESTDAAVESDSRVIDVYD